MRRVISLLILFTLCIASIQAQLNRKITGTVVDNTNNPIIGASVVVMGTTNGNITDLDGKFTLTLTSVEHSKLQVSYIGYTTQEIIITKDKSDYHIVLEEDNMILEEVVVVGYGTSKKMSITGAVSTIKAESKTPSKEKQSAGTWKRSGMQDNSIRLEVGANDFIPLESAQMTVQVDGFRVRVLLDCFFYNNKGNALEGVFKLKLPSEATPYYMAFGETSYMDEDKDDQERAKKVPFVNHRFNDLNLSYQNAIRDKDSYWRNVKEAKMVSKQKAAKAYEQTVNRQIDPALMEWGGADMFSCRVYPLMDKTLHRVVIGYDLNMTEALDFREYIMAMPKVEKNLKLDIVLHSTPDMPVSIIPEIGTPEGKSDDRVYYSLMNPKEKEFKIHYNTAEPVLLIQNDQPRDANLEESLDIPYFAGTYRISLPEVPQENQPADAVFILDTSISSNPDKFNVWLKLIDEILDQNKDIIKRFAVLNFNIDYKWYTNYFQKNNYYNKEQFNEYANTLALEGATDLYMALREASSPSWVKQGKNTEKHIFLMSDGDYNWGETDMIRLLSAITPGDRIHTYKTGLSGTNTGVLNFLSKQTNGFSFTVTGEEEAQLTAKSFRYKPWNIEQIKIEGAEDALISGNPIQLYNGQKLIITGRDIPQGNVSITVSNGIETKQLVYEVKHRIVSPLVSRIYGQVASSHLDNLGFAAEEAAINYSTYYRVPGLHTSLLMLESEWDYQSFGISDYDAKDFIEDNLITDLVKEFATSHTEQDAKALFMAWMKKFTDEVGLSQTDPFMEYINKLTPKVFQVHKSYKTNRSYLVEQQTADEKELLSDDDVRFDRLYTLAKRRVSGPGKPAALRLLSSVVERNAADFQAIHDVAFIASFWDMNEDAFFLMKRLINMRQEEAVCYLAAADALAATKNNIELALVYYYISMSSSWQNVGDFPYITAMKCKRYLKELAKLPKEDLTENTRQFIAYLQEKATGILKDSEYENTDEADILIVTNWNVANTFIDPYVTEPNGETAYYGHRTTANGGLISHDVGRGYGPVVYLLREAESGKYKVDLDYWSDSGPKTASKSKTYMSIYRNWGRKNEKVTRKVVDLSRFSKSYKSNEEEEKRKNVLTFEMTPKK